MKTRRGVSPVIATILLILVAIAAGVILYAYTLGFAGTSPQRSAQGHLIIDAAVLYDGTPKNDYHIYVRNAGNNALRLDSVYFEDTATGNVSHVPFGGPGFRVDFSSTDNTLEPREAAEIHPIPASTRPELIHGREYKVKVVCEDGTTASTTLKAALAP